MIFNEVEFVQLQEILETEVCIVVPVFKRKYTETHYIHNSLVALIVYDLNNWRFYSFSISHCDLLGECLEKDLAMIQPREVYVFRSRYLFRYWPGVMDVELYHWFFTSTNLNVSFNLERMYSKQSKNLGNVIPIGKWIEYAFHIIEQFTKVYEGPEKSFVAYSQLIYRNLIAIEYNGIQCDPNLLEQLRMTNIDSRVFTQYNMTTTTGRPSNTYNRLNFGALPKKDGSRKLLTSKFDNGYLVDFDFDAYHVRMIGRLLNLDYGDVNIHTEFGRQYFQKQELSPEEYQLSKEITFRQLYSDKLEFENDFFLSVERLKDDIWEQFQNKGYMCLPITGRKIKKAWYPDTRRSKMFNYFLQGYETEFSMQKLSKINAYLANKKSNIILYVYDSLVMDFNPEDGKQILSDIKRILKEDGMNVHIKIGKNYHDMKDMTEKI